MLRRRATVILSVGDHRRCRMKPPQPRHTGQQKPSGACLLATHEPVPLTVGQAQTSRLEDIFSKTGTSLAPRL